MKPDQSRSVKIAQAILGILFVPALWPLAFLGAAIYLPGSVDPLLGRVQNVLYVPGLIWLLVTLLATAGIAKVFRLKRTNFLLLATAVGCAFAVSVALSAYSTWGSYQLFGQKGVIYPDHFDAEYEVLKFAKVAAFSIIVSLVTAGAFVCVGGFRLWKSNRLLEA